jgi:phage terminase Nu1 subunit (DNA packaging protein)
MNLKGLPCHGEGRARFFVWHEVLEWYVDYRYAMETGVGNQGNDDPEMEMADAGDEVKKPEDFKAAMLRKTKAEADLKQLALSRMRGEVITILDAKIRVDRMFGNLRTQLLGMAPKVGVRLAGLKDPAEQEAIVKEEMEILCRDLSTGAIVGATADPGDEAETVDIAAAADEEMTDEQLDEYVSDLVEIYASIQL